MSATKLCFLACFTCFLLFLSKAQGQAPLYFKWDPGASFTHKINKRWSANFSLGGLYNGGSFNESATASGLERMEVKAFATYKLFNKQALSGGYMFRKYAPLDTIGYEHRFTEQYSFIWRIGAYRIGNRLRLEQRVRNTGFTNRLRYRFSLDFPLNGNEIDPGEIYLIGSEELVFSFNANDQSLENRLTAGGGWQISDSRKLEVSAEYRFRGTEQPMALHFVTSFYQIL